MKKTITIFALVCLLATTLNAQLGANLPYEPDFNQHLERNKWSFRNPSNDSYARWYFDSGYLYAGYDAESDYVGKYFIEGYPCVSIAERWIETGNHPKIRISFYVNIGGERGIEGSDTSYFDFMSVFFVPKDTNFAAVTGGNLPYYLGTHKTPYEEGLLHFTESGRIAKANQAYSITIDNPSPNSTYKLVFVWRNDANRGDGKGVQLFNLKVKPVTVFDIEVGDVFVSEQNKNDVLGDGKVTYNPDTYTLTLNNVTTDYLNFNAADDPQVYKVVIAPIKLELQGTNNIGTISYEGKSSTSASNKLTIKGNGSLNLNSFGIGITNGTLNIEDCDISVNTSWAGIEGWNGAKLNINKANVTVNSSSSFAIGSFADITLNNVSVIEPQGYQIAADDDGDKYFFNSDGTKAKTVKIQKKDSGIEGIADNGKEINLYPNPAKNFVKIDGANKDDVVVVVDYMGRKVLEQKLINNTLNIQSLPKGIYVVKVSENIQKLVVE